MRLGLFGGTFDPVHLGHLLLAEYCREQCRLDAVWFVPAAEPPHKQRPDLTPARQRIEMLQLAIGGHEAFLVCTREVERGGVSYTVDTLGELAAEQPSRPLFFLLGGDSLADLPRWREPAKICELAMPVVVARPGSPPPDYTSLSSLVSAERLEQIRAHQVDMPQIGLSSREIRRRVAAGLSIRYQTPRAVEKYIETASLYRIRSGNL
ncbi:MAG: nicotinate (nicotinamide) nucleotide adenylyltransferase [Planctomycetia bacterium 21-64-5]|nr:MAG: nicotinate (nicotinamide) nucleotide adenylyltransferase [Planctomycetia bacterium 21-64-5]HQU44730.1 nicotinate-nucleotide adenylyltransferase [Pirellulales bacterium]